MSSWRPIRSASSGWRCCRWTTGSRWQWRSCAAASARAIAAASCPPIPTNCSPTPSTSRCGRRRRNWAPRGISVTPHPGTMVASIVMRFFAALEPLSHIVFSGALHRYPGLKLVSAESDGGWLAFFMILCDDQFNRQRHWSRLELTAPPSEYIRRQVYITFMDDAVACANLKFTGSDNLIWASDYPHSVTTWPNSRSYIEKQMAPCTLEERAKLCAGNAVRLYHLE